MKIIFLDIDGVLNSEEIASHWSKKGVNGYGGFFNETDIIEDKDVKWGQSLVNNLKEIVEKTGASIVISSTWRKYFTIEKFKQMFALYGWNNAPVIGKTKDISKRVGKMSSLYEAVSRGVEIAEYLNSNKIAQYVILDDYNDMLPDQQSHMIETDPLIGLQKSDAERAINILNS